VPDLIYTYPEKPSFTMTNLKKFLTIDDIKLPSSENAGAAIMIIVNKYRAIGRRISPKTIPVISNFLPDAPDDPLLLQPG
jgi:hypothetical protein